MKKYKYTVYFETDKEDVVAGCALDALIKAMNNRINDAKEKFASHIVDEEGHVFEVDNTALLSIIK